MALATALLVGVVAPVAPLASLGAAGALCVACVAALRPERVIAIALAFTGVALVGYAFIGKGFAYLGVPPVYVGEIALLLAILALALHGGLTGTLRSPVIVLLILFGLWSAAQTIPYVGVYGVDALRDAALWGYGAFTLAAGTLLARADAVASVVFGYWRIFRLLPFWAPLFGIVARVEFDRMPRVPGTDVPVLLFKPGDVAVHLAAVGIFVMLGLWRGRDHVAEAEWRWEWLWWALWLFGVIVAVSASRGGFLALVCAFGLVLVLRPRARVWTPVLVAVLLGSLFVASDIAIDVGVRRKISSRQLVANLLSIADTKQDLDLSGTRQWRLAWWGDIIDYTVRGPYFWTGRGFGINLADVDGFQGGLRDYVPNRSPHNVQMTVLARAGVPGALLWIALQVAFVLTMLRASLRARRTGRDWMSRVHLWILAYWLALILNGSFDVYLEGPQGGIWFWCIVGLGIAATRALDAELAREGAGAPRPTSMTADGWSSRLDDEPLAPSRRARETVSHDR